MNKAGSKRLTDTISSAGSMVLFLLFAACCLIMITVAASAYRRITSNYDNTFNSAAAVRYVANRIRACDSVRVISEGAIILSDTGYETVIYEKGGTVYERLFPEGQAVSAENGEALFSTEGFSVKSCGDGLVLISARSDEGKTFTVYCRVPNGGEPVESFDQGR